jgi:O-antigen/teichoic acid export membrane protein
MPQTVLETRHQSVMRPAAKELRALFQTGSLQAGVYIIGFLAGLAAIRLLPVQEFAYYTVANAMLGTLTVAADSGIAQAVLARGGAVWQNTAALSGTFASGSLLRKRIALVGASVALPILYLLLMQQGASRLNAVLISLSIVPLFVTTLSGHLLEVILRLHQRVNALQLIQLRGAALRLAILIGAVALFPQAWLACVVAGLAQLWATSRTRLLAGGLVDVAARPDPEATRDLRARMRRIAPSAVYYAFTGQINVWLLSFFGNANTVAEAGALGRLAMVFGIATAIVSLLYIPRFARLPRTNGARVQRAFWAAQGVLGLAIGAVVGLVWLFPSAALMLLGPHYAALTREVGLAVAGGGLGFLVASTQSFAAARSIVLAPMIIIPATMAIQVVLAILLPVSTLVGVLWFGVIANLVLWLIHTANFAFASRRATQASSA